VLIPNSSITAVKRQQNLVSSPHNKLMELKATEVMLVTTKLHPQHRSHQQKSRTKPQVTTKLRLRSRLTQTSP